MTHTCDPHQDDKLFKIRHIRVHTTLWVEACRKAQAEGSSISRVIRRLLEAYVEGRIQP